MDLSLKTRARSSAHSSSMRGSYYYFGSIAVLFAAGALFASALLRKPVAVALIPLCGLASIGPAAESRFLADNDEAMSRMLTGMTIQPTGDVDRDFVAMMVPHHQGAIDMAQALLRYGHNERLRRLAQEIIVTQQQEIAAMRLALNEPLPPMLAAPDQLGGATQLSSGNP